jgi:hypothetical protein
MRSVTPTAIEIAALAFWLGAAVLFAAVVAPALFAALPTRTLAGAVVGRVLPYIFYSGIVLGLAIAAIEWRAHMAWHWLGAESLGAVIVVACAAAQLIVAPRIERLRAEIGGSLEALSPDDPRRAAFGRLHGVSVGWMGLAMLAAAAALVVIVRALDRAAK